MTKCTICGLSIAGKPIFANRDSTYCGLSITGEPIFAHRDHTYIVYDRSPLCSSCFKAWATGNTDYLDLKKKERLSNKKQRRFVKKQDWMNQSLKHCLS